MTDYPPDKRVYLEQTPAYCRSMGPEVGRYMGRILADHGNEGPGGEANATEPPPWTRPVKL